MSHALALAELFRAAFDADGAFAGVACLGDLSNEEITRPALIFKADTTAQNGSGTALEMQLAVWVETSADVANAAAAHRTLCDLVTTKLHGSGKAALLAAVNASTDYEIHGLNAAPDAPGIDGRHFRSGIAATGSVDVL